MFLMNLFCKEFCLQKGKGPIGEDPTQFSVVLQEQRKLMRAFQPEKKFIEFEAPKWNKTQLVKMMEMLVNSESGIVQYNGVCQDMGKEVVDSMIEYNLIQLRPTSMLSFDISEHTDPIVTSETPAAFVAMKRILRSL